MDRRKLVVALVGAVGLSLMISPAEASTSTVVVHQGPVARLVVHPCTPPVNALHLALQAAARALAGHAVVLRAEAAKLHRVHVLPVVDIDVTAVNTGLGGTAIGGGHRVVRQRRRRHRGQHRHPRHRHRGRWWGESGYPIH